MTDVEKRRLKLLQDTRRSYSEKNSPPAIHPRYQSAYLSLYGDEQSEEVGTRNTFLIRVMISILLFALFFIMDYRKEEIGTVDSQYIISEVQKDLFSEGFPLLIK